MARRQGATTPASYLSQHEPQRQVSCAARKAEIDKDASGVSSMHLF